MSFLTREQLQANIEAMEQQGASQPEIQGYLNAQKTPGNAAKGAVASALTNQPQAQSFSPGSQFGNKGGSGGEFIAKDILGVQPKSTGFFGPLFQNTIGSRGAAGVGQDIGKAMTANVAQHAILERSGTRNSLTKSADSFIEAAKNEKDPIRKAKLLEQARQAIGQSASIGQEQEQLSNDNPRVNALGTGGKMLNAGLSVVGAEKGANVIRQTLKGRIGQGAIQGLKGGAVVGGGSEIAGGLIDQKSARETAKDAALGTVVGGTAGLTLGALLPTAANAPRLVKALTPKSESIMNRVARLNPSDALKFEKLAGKSHGQYLVETGNFGTPKKIVENEAFKFTNSLDEVDNALASLPGNYKSKPLETVLDDLVKREREIGVPNTETIRIRQLASKARREGLSMSEINEAKRIYERTVKLGYLKEQNSIGIARSTRLDSALREWQFELAEKLGLENLPELNKQTQLSKFIIDKLGKQLVGKSGNQAITLTDWIILSGGDPAAIASFLAKKGFLNKGFQAGFARFISKTPAQPAIKAQFNQKTSQAVKPPTGLPPARLGKSLPSNVPPQVNPVKDSLKNQRGFVSFGSSQGLTTKILQKLEGRKTVSRQFIEDLTNSGDLRQAERDLFRRLLKDEGDQIDVPSFSSRVQTELLPLKRQNTANANPNRSALESGGGVRYESIALPDELRGPIANYSEHIYESPIKTSAGGVHFSNTESSNYFAHTRIEDLAESGRQPIKVDRSKITDPNDFRLAIKGDTGYTPPKGVSQTRRVIEIQSDLFQKGRLEMEKAPPVGMKDFPSEIAKRKELEKLEPYRNTWHERIIREEIKQAAKDGKTRLQFPTGETAMKIEGLGENLNWSLIVTEGKAPNLRIADRKLMPEDLKVGGEIRSDAQHWIITDVLGDGKFKAVQKRNIEVMNDSEIYKQAKKDGLIKMGEISGDITKFPDVLKKLSNKYSETFDISGKVDTSNPIYKFYEKDVQKFLNKFGGKRVKDAQGVEWIEVPITKEMGKSPVQAFGKSSLGVLGVGALTSGALLAAPIVAGKIQRRFNQ